MLFSRHCRLLNKLAFFVLATGLPFCAHTAAKFAWSSQQDIPVESWPNVESFWGRENISYPRDPELMATVIRVFMPKGSYDPGSMRKMLKPLGGAGFKVRLLPVGTDRATLSYRVRFPPDFDFVLGGKLPGLFGGGGNSGGYIPNGSDGFSFRLMWGAQGNGTVYAYLPTSIKYGTPLLHKKFRFVPGRWHTVLQELVLNTPGISNGFVRMWIDGQQFGEASGLLVRSTDALKINGVFFDVFFGGGDPSWATPSDTYIEFSDFIFRAYAD